MSNPTPDSPRSEPNPTPTPRPAPDAEPNRTPDDLAPRGGTEAPLNAEPGTEVDAEAETGTEGEIDAEVEGGPDAGSDGDSAGREDDSSPATQPYGRRATDGDGRGRRGRTPDRMLALLLQAAERDVRLGVTVSAGGAVVTGTLIGTLAYCRALADQFASTAGGTEMDEGFASSFRDLVDDAIGTARGDRRQPPDAAAFEHSAAFLHLADARFVTTSGVLPHGRHGVLWRCPVSAVGSWSVGELIP